MRKTKKPRTFSIAGAGLLVAGIAFLLLAAGAVSESDLPQIVLAPESYNFGKIRRLGGKVAYNVVVKNQGKNPLTVTGVGFSWMCVTATLEVAGRKSPLFEMHKNYPGWRETLAPEQQGRLSIYFDPNFHGSEGLGRIRREVNVISSDPERPVAILDFLATVVD